MKFMIRILALALTVLSILVIVSCEDDAILEPTESDECTGSYCSLALPGSSNYALLAKNNPRSF